MQLSKASQVRKKIISCPISGQQLALHLDCFTVFLSHPGKGWVICRNVLDPPHTIKAGENSGHAVFPRGTATPHGRSLCADSPGQVKELHQDFKGFFPLSTLSPQAGCAACSHGDVIN